MDLIEKVVSGPLAPMSPTGEQMGVSHPPLSRRWDYRFHPEALPSGSHGLQLYGSSLSSTSKGSRSRISSDHFSNHQYSVSDGIVSYLSSPSDSFHGQHWNAFAQGISNESQRAVSSTTGLIP